MPAAIPNSFFAQAGDLEDAWGPASGPCFSVAATDWECCSGPTSRKGVYLYEANRSSAACQAGTKGKPEICDPACAAAVSESREHRGLSVTLELFLFSSSVRFLYFPSIFLTENTHVISERCIVIDCMCIHRRARRRKVAFIPARSSLLDTAWALPPTMWSTEGRVRNAEYLSQSLLTVFSS